MTTALRVAGDKEGNGRVARAVATAMRMASNEEGNDRREKSNGDSIEGGRH